MEQSLSCTINSDVTINDNLGKAFFQDIVVTKNGVNHTLLGPICRVRNTATYTVKCFHNEDMDEASGGLTTPLIILCVIIVFLLVLVIIFYRKWKKEKSDHNETKKRIEPAENREMVSSVNMEMGNE